MVIEYIRYVIRAERAEEFHDAYRKASATLEASPECLGYELSQGIEEPANWILRIRWSSLEDHEKGFRNGPNFGPFLAHVGPFLGDIQEMKHYQVTDMAGEL
jgi:quinol monooxygenase YgiN